MNKRIGAVRCRLLGWMFACAVHGAVPCPVQYEHNSVACNFTVYDFKGKW